jgi:protein SCO1/2
MHFKLIISTIVATTLAGAVHAQDPQLEYELQGVDVVERIGEPIPRDLTFTDDNGRSVKLAQYLKTGRPLLITLNYAECPRLCSYQLNDLAKAMRDMEWVAGREFVALTVSINPAETFKTAKQAKLRYLGIVGKQEADAGWHYLTSPSDADIHALTDALGFKYRFDPDSGEYRHKSALFIVNGDGVISHYLRNLAYNPTDLQAQLKASAEGKLGEPSQDDSGFGLNCFALEYTDNISRAFNMMRLGGVGILLFLFSFVGYWWYRELRKPREEQVQAEAT